MCKTCKGLMAVVYICNCKSFLQGHVKCSLQKQTPHFLRGGAAQKSDVCRLLITLSQCHACSIWTNQMCSRIFSTAKNLRYAKHHVFHKRSIFSGFYFCFASVWYYIQASVNEFGFWSSSREYLVEGKPWGSIFFVTVTFKTSFTVGCTIAQ